MVYSQWKQRLYAFLVRRIVGPYLDASSLQKLHESIEVSLQEGKFVLRDIQLNSAYLSLLLSKNGTRQVASVSRARIRKLQINLSLEEPGRAKDGSRSSSSVAWRAMQLGRTASSDSNESPHGVILVAHVEMDGLSIELEPFHVSVIGSIPRPSTTTTTDTLTNDGEHTTAKRPAGSSSSMISSYIDAAVSSLRLSVQLNDLLVQISTCCSRDEAPKRFLEIQLASAFYHDVEKRPPASNRAIRSAKNDSSGKVALHKAIDFAGVMLRTGDEQNAPCNGAPSRFNTCTIGRTEGNGRISFRALEYPREPSSASVTSDETKPSVEIQHDVEVVLNQKLSILVDETSLGQILSVTTALSAEQKRSSGVSDVVDSSDQHHEPYDRMQALTNEEDEEEDIQMMSGILKQYAEARQLAERNEVRGGILIPRTAAEDGDTANSVAFDAFFDANDQSFYHYTSMLQRSAFGSMTGERADESDLVHSRIKFHLMECGVKIAFTRKHSESGNEYMLFSLSDINVSSSLSHRSSDHSVTISHLAIEDSYFESDELTGAVRSEIGSILRFVQMNGPDSASSALVSEAPCVSVDIRFQKKGSEPPELRMDLDLEPFQVMVRLTLLSSIQRLCGNVKSSSIETVEDVTPTSTNVARPPKLKICARCSFISLGLPLGGITANTGYGSDPCASLFDRCGEVLQNMAVTTQSSLDMAFEAVTLSLDSEKEASVGRGQITEQPDQFMRCTVRQLSCLSVLLSLTSPRRGEAGSTFAMHRIDIMSLSGPSPVSLTHISTSSYSQQKALGKAAFPITPSLSSFKARQEDDDDADSHSDDKCTHPVLSSKMDYASVSESPLRAADPQTLMLDQATSCSSLIELEIPEIACDLTKAEALALANMLQSQLVTSQGTAQKYDTSALPKYTDSIAISIIVDQATFAAHHQIGDDDESAWYSFKLLLEGWRMHGVLSGSRLMTARILAHEANFFEGRDIVSFLPKTESDLRIDERCSRLRQRCMTDQRSHTALVTPIFYRSQLFSPLSQENPSILFDALSLTEPMRCASGNGGSWRIHFTMYNMTHRYDVDSTWYENLKRLLASNGKRPSDSHISMGSATKTCLIKLFVSLADCNVDYTSPLTFDRPSRMILRLGDLRGSSNIVSPAGPVQACKISLGDITAQLCSSRYSHNFENVLITRASTTLHPRDLLVPSRKQPEQVLHDMDLVTMLTLDSLDTQVALANDYGLCGAEDRIPKLLVDLTFGNLCIYGCKDSFSCFADTIAEWQLCITALNEDAVLALKSKSAKGVQNNNASDPEEAFFDNRTNDDSSDSNLPICYDSVDNKSTHENTDQPIETVREDFGLDGYDWTTVDHEWSKHGGLRTGDEQSAKWYSEVAEDSSQHLPVREDVQILAGHYGSSNTCESGHRTKLRIISDHIQLQPVADPLGQTDMDAAKYAHLPTAPPVLARILVRDLHLRCRFFDGYDWPLLVESNGAETKQGKSHKYFVIDDCPGRREEAIANVQENMDKRPDHSKLAKQYEKKMELLGDLLDENDQSKTNTFCDTPLPEDRSKLLDELATKRRLARRMDRFFQISLSGLKLRVDAFEESETYRLASCLDMSIADFFLAETISSIKPIKMLGEWFNEIEHPRVSTDGLIMMKMVTWHSMQRVDDTGKVSSDDSVVRLQMLPLRCRLDQRAFRFVQAFFASDGNTEPKHEWAEKLKLKEIPPPRFVWFKVKPCKMKVNYSPVQVNVDALRNGSYVELINISPLVDMVIVLQEVFIQDKVGFGAVVSEMLGRWIEDICATQMYKFVTNARPFQPISSLSGGAADLFVLPWQAYKEGGRVGRAIRSGATSFAETFAYETLNTTAQLLGATSRTLSSAVSSSLEVPTSSGVASSLPSRPEGIPHDIRDTATHALESLARGVETANYKVIIVPYREYHRSGATGAARSVMRGIPVAVMAPIGAASEALSYTLLGARNQVRPDIRKEEEASERGLHRDL